MDKQVNVGNCNKGLMQYHLFTGCKIAEGRWLMFLYEDKDTCVETWNYHPKYGTDIRKVDKPDIPIKKRIFILGTTQHGQVNKYWEHKQVTEDEALFMLFDSNL